MSENYFNRRVATSYDTDSAAMFDQAVVGPAVDCLAELAGSGLALEFAIGTGRIALPLLNRGVAVTGIDSSEEMAAELRKKGVAGRRLPVVIGDMTTATAPGVGGYTLVYLVYNTIQNLTTQDGQTECFLNATRHLLSGGYFVIETGVPQLRRLPPGQQFVPFALTSEHVGIDEYDTVTQSMTSHHIRLRNGVNEHILVPFRYVWPSELDLMARLAGMELVGRSSDWKRSPFTQTSDAHISIWRKP